MLSTVVIEIIATIVVVELLYITMLYCITIDHMYRNQMKFLLPKPIATPHIAPSVNECDIVVIERYCHKYGPIAT
jgi:hypothetical protein